MNSSFEIAPWCILTALLSSSIRLYSKIAGASPHVLPGAAGKEKPVQKPLREACDIKVNAARTASIRHAQIFLFTDRKINFDRIYLRTRGKDRSRSHEISHLDGVDTGDAVLLLFRSRKMNIMRILIACSGAAIS